MFAVDSLTQRPLIILLSGFGVARLTIREIVRKDLEINELDGHMICDRILWRRLIHVADPT
jgi:hypothetical protein